MPVDTKRRLGGAPTATAGAPSAGAAAQSAAPQPAAQKVGTGFVNMSDILAANRSGAQAMGQGLANRVATQGQAAQHAQKIVKDQFDAGVARGTNTFNAQGLNNREQTRAGAARGYTGPRTWADIGVNTVPLAEQTAKAQDSAKALTSQGGRAALLREQAPGLTAGGASLDAFLAGAGMGGRGQQVAQQYGNLSDILAGNMGAATGQVKDAEATTAASQQQYRDLEAGWDAADLQQQYDNTHAENEQLRPENEDVPPGRRRAPGRRDDYNPRSP